MVSSPFRARIFGLGKGGCALMVVVWEPVDGPLWVGATRFDMSLILVRLSNSSKDKRNNDQGEISSDRVIVDTCPPC